MIIILVHQSFRNSERYLLLNKELSCLFEKFNLIFRTNFRERVTNSICEFVHFNLRIYAVNYNTIYEFKNLCIYTFVELPFNKNFFLNVNRKGI